MLSAAPWREDLRLKPSRLVKQVGESFREEDQKPRHVRGVLVISDKLVSRSDMGRIIGMLSLLSVQGSFL